MKRIVLWLMSTLTVLVLLFGYHTSTSSKAAAQGGNVSASTPVQGGTASGNNFSTSGGSAAASSPAAPAGGTGSATASSAAAPTAAGSGAASTVKGLAADTRFGPVQVQLTVQNGTITKVAVPVYPNESRRDQEINAQALPILVQETLKAQSAHIDMVSGATYTSDGYLQSLQSALDKAGL